MDSTARTGCIAGIVVLFLAAAVGVVVVIAGSGKPGATGAQAQQQAAGKDVPARSDDGPYPESAEIVKWMRSRSGEPKTLEIISWDKREDASKWEGYEGITIIQLRYRGKNQYGGMTTGKMMFHYKGGRMVKAMRADGLVSQWQVVD